MSEYQEITKGKLFKLYGLSDTHGWRLLNVEFYEELKKVGYVNKYCKILPPKVVRRFIELYDPPIKKDEI